jgi:biopolymer transport protein ExbB
MPPGPGGHVVDKRQRGKKALMSVIAVAAATQRMCFFRLRLETYVDKRELELDLMRRLHFIATVGSNAPYIGLLGTHHV